jgi:ubiquinone biosynthesis monooxygenase Coq7
MLRVDQAGEYGATRIYAGQLAVMGNRAPACGRSAAHGRAGGRAPRQVRCADGARGVRPTALQPLLVVAGFALGAATALIGPEAAMACTAAIEEEIDRHYTQQLDELGDDDPELAAMIAHFRDDERAHRDAALAAGAERAPAYPLLSGRSGWAAAWPSACRSGSEDPPGSPAFICHSRARRPICKPTNQGVHPCSVP